MLKLVQEYPSAIALKDADLGQLSEMLIADSYRHKKRGVCRGADQGRTFVNRYQKFSQGNHSQTKCVSAPSP
jgi:hypothetical protein